MEKELKQIEKLATNLLELLTIEASIKVHEDKKEDKGAETSVTVQIETKDAGGLLIGAHGTTLLAIESFLNIAYKAKTGEWLRINVDIGDWKEKQKENLVSLGSQAAKRAKETGEPQYLYNLTSGQRREIHLSLKNAKEIETESVGEGEDRYLIIRSK